MEEEFNNIDKNGGGYILFDEFCDWAIQKGLRTEQSRLNDQGWSTQKQLGAERYKQTKIETCNRVKYIDGLPQAMPYNPPKKKKQKLKQKRRRN